MQDKYIFGIFVTRNKENSDYPILIKYIIFSFYLYFFNLFYFFKI